MSNIKELARNLLKELDESVLDNLDENELLALRKELNPYGRTIEGSKKFLNLSYTNLREEYIKKFMMTSLIAFLNRMCDEWKVPDNMMVTPVYEYVKNPTILDKNIQKTETNTQKNDRNFNKHWMQKRIIVKQFIEDMFQFDPDIHVRSSYRPNIKDQTRKVLYTPPAQLAVWNLRKEMADTKDKVLKKSNKELIEKYDESKKLAKKTNDYQKNLDKTKYKLTKTKVSDTNIVDNSIKSNIFNMIPSQDVFGRFKIYYETNFEVLRESVKDLYGIRPDFELAINPLSWHKTEEDSEKFKRKHAKEVITDIVTLSSGKWNILGPFKESREKISFYNEHTTVLEEMFKQLESDAKLGSELMKKRVKIKKIKNIQEHGPDNEGLEYYKQHFGTQISSIGKVDPKKELYKYRVLEEPENAVEVPVFKISEGGTKIERDFFYTEEALPDCITEQKKN